MVFVLVAAMMSITAAVLLYRDGKNRVKINNLEKQIKILYHGKERQTTETREAEETGKTERTSDKPTSAAS